MKCAKCGEPMCGVQYWYTEPEHYDGVSEWKCEGCNIRIGRWTGKKLKNGDVEPRYGKGKK